LIRQILTYSRNQEVKREPINLTVILAETMQLLSNTLPSSVILQASNDHPQVIASANATQIQEVLINLCNNAVHAMDGQGKLTLALEQVEVSEEKSLTVGRLKAGSYARLSISDTGHGMEPAILEKIFDPFFTTKPQNEGTGMGLSTVLGIVQQHEGLINVRSALGQGSTFEIYFPLVDVEPLVTDKAETGLFVGTEKVLFLDDEEMLATLGGRLLTEMGYEVTIETNSLKALEMIKEDPDRFDLVITDQTMPELTGKELAQELQKLRPELPIILCTGYSSKISEEDAGKYGITTFCLKPLDFLDFSKKIRNALDRGK
jgi:CheY-like chemotaxis protein